MPLSPAAQAAAEEMAATTPADFDGNGYELKFPRSLNLMGLVVPEVGDQIADIQGNAADALTSKNAAAGSATAAAGSATAAGTARTGAETARTGAETARNQALAVVQGNGAVFNLQGGAQAGEIMVFADDSGTLVASAGLKPSDIPANNFVVTPRNIAPATGSTGQGLNGNPIVLQVTDYLQLAGVAFKSRRFRVATDIAMTNVVVDSGALTTAGNSFTIADPVAAGLSPSTQYYWQANYIDTNDKVSDWSTPSGFVTAAKLAVGFGDPYGGGFYYGLVEYGGQRYRLVSSERASGHVTRAFKSTATADSASFSDFDGVANMALMTDDATYPAAAWCRAFRGGGFSDWYLGARYEIDAGYLNLKPSTTANVTTEGVNAYAVPARATNYTAGDPAQTAVADFRDSGSQSLLYNGILSSTPLTTTTVYAKAFATGASVNLGKNISNRYIVPIRRVPVSA